MDNILDIVEKILIPYFDLRNSKLKENQKYSDKEYQKLLNSEFSIAEKTGFTCIIIVSIMFFFVGLMFAIYFLASSIQSNYFVGVNALLFQSTVLSKIIFLLIGFIVGIFLNNIFLNFIGYIMPRFNTFVSRNRARMTCLKEIEDKEKKIKDIKTSIKILLIIAVVATPLLALALDNYYYVNPQGLTTNSFLSFNEKKYDWNQIQKVTVNARPYHDKGALKFDLSYNIITKDGNSFDVWGNNFQKILSVDNLINANGIIIEREDRTQELVNYINYAFSPETARMVLKILVADN